MAQQPKLSAQLEAMVREAVKDGRNTIHQFFYGRPEGASEIGAPMSPTPQELTVSREVVGNFNALLDQQAARGSVHGREQDKGIER